MMLTLNVIVAVLAAVVFHNERRQRRRAESNAEVFEKRANDTLAELTKVQRQNRDLTERMREQTKSWANRVRKAEGR